MRVLIFAAATMVVASCFDPTELDGALRCTEAMGCPSGFECREDLLCWRRGTGRDGGAADDGAGVVDAAGPDAPPEYDAPPPACANGVDDDCDGKVDRDDPGCLSGQDNDEHGTKKCDDGIDNDVDGYADFHVTGCGPQGDPQCDKPDDDSE